MTNAASGFAIAVLAIAGLLLAAPVAHAAGTAVIQGQVTTTTGDPLPVGVEVHLLSTITGELSQPVAADGSYRFTELDADAYQAWAEDPSGMFSMAPITGLAVADGDTLTQDLIMAPVASSVGTVRGTITDTLGAVVADRQVGLASTGGGAPVYVHSDSSGQYEFTGVTPGEYRVWLPAGSLDGTMLVTVTAGSEAAMNFTVIAESTLGAIGGTVTDPEGNSISGVEVAATGRYAASAVTAADGTYRISSLPAGTYEVTFTAPDGQVQTVTDVVVRGGEDSLADQVFVPLPGVIQGTVADPDGNAIAGAVVSIEIGGTPQTVTSAADGTFTITGVPAGTYPLAASDPSGAHRDGRTDAVVGSGETAAVVIVLQPVADAGDGPGPSERRTEPGDPSPEPDDGDPESDEGSPEPDGPSSAPGTGSGHSTEPAGNSTNDSGGLAATGGPILGAGIGAIALIVTGATLLTGRRRR